jgi:hypothetical protein
MRVRGRMNFTTHNGTFVCCMPVQCFVVLSMRNKSLKMDYYFNTSGSGFSEISSLFNIMIHCRCKHTKKLFHLKQTHTHTQREATSEKKLIKYS